MQLAILIQLLTKVNCITWEIIRARGKCEESKAAERKGSR